MKTESAATTIGMRIRIQAEATLACVASRAACISWPAASIGNTAATLWTRAVLVQLQQRAGVPCEDLLLLAILERQTHETSQLGVDFATRRISPE